MKARIPQVVWHHAIARAARGPQIVVMLGGLSRPPVTHSPCQIGQGLEGSEGALNADHLALGGLVSSLTAFVRGKQLGLNLGGDK